MRRAIEFLLPEGFAGRFTENLSRSGRIFGRSGADNEESGQ